MKGISEPVGRILCAAVFALLVSAANISAATFTVSNTNDSGAGSLRQAVLDANAAAGADTIVFGVLFNSPQVITLTSGDIVFADSANSNVTITGPGAGLLTVSGNNASKIFTVLETPVVVISGMTLANGNGVGTAPGSTFGGAIYNQGDLTLNNVVVTNNSATADGGGLYSSTGDSITLNNCVVSNNTANSDSVGNGTGGGLRTVNAGTAVVSDSIFVGNRTLEEAGGPIGNFQGGGLFLQGTVTLTRVTVSSNRAKNGGGVSISAATVNISDSTIDNNFANGAGGGIQANSSSGTWTNVTVSGNRAIGDGGGIYKLGSGPTIVNSTVANNVALIQGGGMFSDVTVGFSLRSVIVANNSAPNGPDFSGTFNSLGYNLVRNISGTSVNGDPVGNVYNADPLLGALSNNGGPTRTHAPLNGSPAIDAGDPATFAPNDQRGISRPQDGDGTGGPRADMGAYERRQSDTLGHLAADFDGDGRSDLSVFRPSLGQWWLNRSTAGLIVHTFGNSADVTTPGDFTGDGSADVAIFRPSSGGWFVLRSEDFSFYSFPFGATGDVPVPADYDGDGRTDAAVFRPSNATWFIQRSSGGTTIQGFGAPTDRPVPADYDGDGRTDIAIYRPALGQWWLNRSAAGLIVHTFGNSADRNVPGDYTGDGKADVAIWRPSDGNWFVLRSEDSSFYSFPFGSSTDLPVPGDYDGDGRFDAGVFRPSNATWYLNRSTAGVLIQGFGLGTDLPVPYSYVR